MNDNYSDHDYDIPASPPLRARTLKPGRHISPTPPLALTRNRGFNPDENSGQSGFDANHNSGGVGVIVQQMAQTSGSGSGSGGGFDMELLNFSDSDPEKKKKKKTVEKLNPKTQDSRGSGKSGHRQKVETKEEGAARKAKAAKAAKVGKKHSGSGRSK